ncbi:MAG: hypothetical protein IKF97_07460 [Clostridia bacterium]|nr:hypothetical protein [Clostridia bacterium]
MNKNKILISIIIFTIFIVALIIVLNQSDKYNELSVSESKWNDIKESRMENNNLVLEDIKFNDYKLIIDEKNNTLYYCVTNDSQNKYNPNVSYSTNSKNMKLAVLSDNITDEKVKNNYQFKVMIYNEKEYHIYNLECIDIPILNITYNKDEEIKQSNIPMEMYLFDNLSNIPNKVTLSSGKIKMYENNYIFSLHMLTPGKNKRDNRISILNMKPNSEYILKKLTNIPDTSQGGGENKKNRVELFFNNEYKGVYYLDYMDKNKENLEIN